MQPKTKIYIDKDSLEIIAQDSSISDNYYRKIIEIFRRHADLYLDMNDEELNSLREPKDLNDPGDIYSFIEGKSLPWPSAAIDNFNALHNNNGCPEINGNVIYILSKKDDVKKIREYYGVWAIYIDDINDDVFYYAFSPDLDRDEVPGNKNNGWYNILKDEIGLIPTSNSFVISDSNLLTNNKINQRTGENHFCSLENLRELLNLILPEKMNVPFFILIICPPTRKLEEGKMKKIVRRWIKEIKLLRQYSIIIEFLITNKTLHSRDLYANNYRIHLDKGFYVFEPWSIRIHREDISHNDMSIDTYLSSPFQRGKSLLDKAISELKLLNKKYDAFRKGTGDPYIVNLLESSIKPSDFDKNRVLF
jgi:hypothetical protein